MPDIQTSSSTPTGTLPPLDPRVGIGHVHLKVADIDRGLSFWRDAIGLEVQQWYAARRSSCRPAGITTISR